jgi:ribulose-phosphate 3-epimerase
MNKRILIAPSILAADFTKLGDEVRAAEQAGADWIHIDVMDGQFVPNITMGPLIVEAVRRVTSLPLDVHLMIIQPEQIIEAFAKAGASHITVHVEAAANPYEALRQIQGYGCRAGIAINPHTPVDRIQDLVTAVDIVNVMTVEPGFGGQAYMADMNAKIMRLREMINASGRPVDLEVDGGITSETAANAVQAGANVLVAGSSIFHDRLSIAHGMHQLREALTSL